MKSCPEPLQLSMYCDEAAEVGAARAIDAHLERCARCRATVAEERRLAAALGSLTCPDPETLARFVDEALDAAQLERVAGHVLRCEPCREVVTWTREAQAAVSGKLSKSGVHGDRRASGRRRRHSGAAPAVRRAGERRASPWAGLLGAGAAVAAAVLLAVLLRGPGGALPGPGSVAQTPPTPRPAPHAPPSPGPVAPTPGLVSPSPTAPGQDPAPTAPPPAELPPVPVDPVRPPSGETPPVGETPPAPQPGSDPQLAQDPTAPGSSQVDPVRPPATGEGLLVAALDEDALSVRPAQGAVYPLQGAARVAPGSALVAGREGAALQIGRATCLLTGGAELACLSANPNEAALQLGAGEVMVDAPDAALELRAGEAAVRAAPGGARYALGLSGGSAILCVVSGEARFGGPGAVEAVQAGQVVRWEKGQLRAERRPEPAQARARELAVRAELAASVDVPRGLIALRALRAAETGLSAGQAAARARAVEAVFALRAAEPRLAKLAARLLPAAEAALAELSATDPAALARDGAAAPLLLALLDQARAVQPGKGALSEAARGQVQGLAQALAALPSDELAAQPEALLALRAAERSARYRAPRAAFEGAAPAEAADPQAALLHALLAKRKDAALAARVLGELEQALGRSPWDAPLDAPALLRATRLLALLDEETPARHQRLVAHAWALSPADDPSLALLVAQETRALLGEKPLPLAPASLLVVPAAEGWRVTFVHRPAKRLKSLHLVASWDGWKPEGIAMELRADGSWVVTQVLPPGRHEYKLIVERDAWITDAANPLTGPSNVNESENSVLLLD